MYGVSRKDVFRVIGQGKIPVKEMAGAECIQVGRAILFLQSLFS